MISRYLGVLRPLQRSLTLPALLLSCLCAQAVEPSSAVCARCHPKEVQAYARTGMAQSIFSVSQAPAIPSGAFTHAASNTQFTISATPFGIRQSSQRQNQITEQNVAFVIGSGNHAFGFLMQTGDHIFQSPLSYYTHRRAWDMAPGYEMNPHPDFARPIATECLLCHSGRPLPIAHTLNRYEPAVFASLAITCDRCHGSAEGHLKRPVPGSIVNPAKLAASERDSVCEQCHLKGEIRIPNPGKELTDFHPGQRAEDVFTTFVTSRPDGKTIKVVSHVEQLARSVCARQSAGKLWCGTCHNPHDQPPEASAVSYYRARCLSCHASSLDSAHAAPDRDCVACHMPRRTPSDGGHTAFTDHRIARNPDKEEAFSQPASIVAWRPSPESSLQQRNLALALAHIATEHQSAALLASSYQMLNYVQRDFPNDPNVLSQLGLLALISGHQPQQAYDLFDHVAQIQPDSAEAQTNMAAALIRLNRQSEAVAHLEKALALDPLSRSSVNLLVRLYQQQGDNAKASDILTSYRRAMGIKTTQ